MTDEPRGITELRRDPALLRRVLDELAREIVRHRVALGDSNITAHEVLAEAHRAAEEQQRPHHPVFMSGVETPSDLRLVEAENGRLVAYADGYIGGAKAERIVGALVPCRSGEVRLLIADRRREGNQLYVLYRDAGQHRDAPTALATLRAARAAGSVLGPQSPPGIVGGG
jgi:hypothetical protein